MLVHFANLKKCLTPSNADQSPAVITIQSRWGRLIWRAYPTLSGTSCMLHCQRQEPIEVQALSAAWAAGLSGSQQIVAAKLISGHSYRQIANQMKVKESTVVDCVRCIYRRLDLHGVDALAKRLRMPNLSV